MPFSQRPPGRLLQLTSWFYGPGAAGENTHGTELWTEDVRLDLGCGLVLRDPEGSSVKEGFTLDMMLSHTHKGYATIG